MRILLILILISCASNFDLHDSRRRRSVEPKSIHELKQNKILNCTKKHMHKGVDFGIAVKSCEDARKRQIIYGDLL